MELHPSQQSHKQQRLVAKADFQAAAERRRREALGGESDREIRPQAGFRDAVDLHNVGGNS
jgi:hypothetical protein